ncbi:V-set and immunoglobulin domain-containing protein 10-like 2 isoform X2 [Ambystoma mexicanum]
MLACLVKNGTGPIDYTWHRNTVQEGTVPVAEGNGSQVLFTAVNRTHIGWYTCTGKNEVNQETSDRVYLDVIYGPDDPVINIQPFAISESGFAANEQEEVTMTCLASSNPPCQYVWFYNNSQIYSGQMYVISKISRSQTGTYTCLAQNSHLNTRTQLTISLTVYYLPDGAPTCTALARNNYKDVALWCSWSGGLPPARLRWLKSSDAESDIEAYSNVTRIKRGAEIRNDSSYTCIISHPGLRGDAVCRTTVSVPTGEPNCSVVATAQNEYIMLSCELGGGLPRVLLDWDTNGLSDSKESTNIYVIKSNASYNGKLFTCTALHPLNANAKRCQVRLESPSLETEQNQLSIMEGGSIQLPCQLTASNPSSKVLWYDNKNSLITQDSAKYGVQQQGHWSNLTVRDAEWNVDGGDYQCSAVNAVGNAKVTVKLIIRPHPTPPNVTISKLMYTKQRTEVDVEWMTKGAGNLTGFIVQRQVSKRSAGKSFPNTMKVDNWDNVINDIEPEIRGHKLGGLDPSIVYAFRILAVNHRTTGFPSEVKTPADPPFNAYPAVIGACLGGMVITAVVMLVVFQYIVRNRDNNPRLHDLFFRPAPAEAREHISSPEDAETAADIEDPESNNAPAASSPEPAPVPSAASGSSAAADGSPQLTSAAAAISQLSAAVPPDDSPVNVTITVTAAP